MSEIDKLSLEVLETSARVYGEKDRVAEIRKLHITRMVPYLSRVLYGLGLDLIS